MNIIETIYCSQYYELKKSGRDPMSGRINGTMLSATMILLVMVAVFFLANRFLPGHLLSSNSGHGYSGRFIGKMVGLVGLAAIGGTLNFTYGSKARYVRMMTEWEKLPEDVLQQTVKSAIKTFFIVFGAFLLVMLICFI